MGLQSKYLPEFIRGSPWVRDLPPFLLPPGGPYTLGRTQINMLTSH